MTDTTYIAMTTGQKLHALAHSKSAQAIAATMVMKVASAAVAFALFSLAARAAGAEEFGRFSILFSILSILSIVANAGQPLLMMRGWNEYLASQRHGEAYGILRFGMAVSLVGCLLVSLFILIAPAVFDLQPVLGIKPTEPMLMASIAFLVANTLALFSSHVTRASVGISMGDANYELTWRGLGIVFLAGALLFGYSVTSTEILGVFALGLLLVIGSQAIAVSRAVAREIGKVKARYVPREWSARSIRLWLAAVMEACNQHMEVFLIGLLLDPFAAGAYFVAVRLSNAFALAASGINTYGTRRVPALYYAKDAIGLRHTLHLMAGMSLLIVSGGMAVVGFAGDYMLLIFGEHYADYYWVLLTLCIGTGMSAANGPAPSILMLTGHEGRYMTIVTLSVLMRIVGFLVVIPTYGILGAAIVTASVMSVMSIIINIQCRKLTGLDPSVLRFLLKSEELPAAMEPEPSDINRS